MNWFIFAIVAILLAVVLYPPVYRWWKNRGRDIFSYWDGSRQRSIDPMIPYRFLAMHPSFDWDKHPQEIKAATEMAESGDPTKARASVALLFGAMEQLVPAVREAFRIKDYDEGGLTERETMDLFTDFLFWMADLKKKSSFSPTTAERMGFPADDSATPTSLGSFSTSKESAEPAASIA